MTRQQPQHAAPATYLGIDVGTSATKAVILASDGTVLARSRVPHPAARGAGARPGRPVGLAGQHHRSRPRAGPAHRRPSAASAWTPTAPPHLLLDADGEPLAAGITWDHPGLAEPTAQLIAALDPAHRRLIGNHLMPATAMGAAHRLLQTIEPQAAAAATTFGLAGTWLGQWLTGERAIDPTQASYTGLMASTDGSCRWLADVLQRLGHPAGAAAAGAAVAERARPAAADRGRDSRPAAGHSGAWSDPATPPPPPTRWAPSRAAGRCSSWAPPTWCPTHWPPRTRAPRRCNGSTSEPAGG